jgi:hypothetical protein
MVLVACVTAIWLIAKPRRTRTASGPEPRQKTTNQESPSDHPTSQVASPREEFTRRWLRPLSVFTVVLVIVAAALWPEGFTADTPTPTEGGILIFTEGTDEVWMNVQANVVSSSVPGVAIMVLDLTGAGQIDFRAHVVASGQYAIFDDKSVVVCRQPSESHSGTPACPSTGYNGNPHTMLKNSPFGVVLEGDTKPQKVNAFDAYDPATATAIAGTSVGRTVRFEIPFALPEPTQIGVSRYRSFAAVGTSGVAPPKPRDSLDPGAQRAESYTDLSTRRSLQLANIRKLTFITDPPAGPWQLQWASPAPDRSDQLVWTADAKGLGPVSYQTVNPFNQNTLSQRGFLAGVGISLASAAFLLIVEQYLAHRRLKPRKRDRSA